MSKEKVYEALLVISTALLVIYLYGVIRYEIPRPVFIYVASGVGISGILIKPLGELIAKGWFKLAELLSFVMSKVVMTIVFVVILIPVALLYRMVKKDKLYIKKAASATTWTERKHIYSDKDLKNIW